MPYIKEIQILQWLKKGQTGCETFHESSSNASLFPVFKDRTDAFYICRQCMCSLKRYL